MRRVRNDRDTASAVAGVTWRFCDAICEHLQRGGYRRIICKLEGLTDYVFHRGDLRPLLLLLQNVAEAGMSEVATCHELVSDIDGVERTIIAVDESSQIALFCHREELVAYSLRPKTTSKKLPPGGFLAALLVRRPRCFLAFFGAISCRPAV